MNGPGQNCATASGSAHGIHYRFARYVRPGAIGQMNDERIEAGQFLRLEDFDHGFTPEGIGREPINGFRG